MDTEHFDYLENRLGMKLREKLPAWQTFIEVTERRNLLVHCDGIISNQYLKNCTDHNCSLDNLKTGDRVGVNPEYFSKAYKCLYEITVKLTHTIWRKLLKDDLKNADRELNDICYQLINNSSFELADILLEFAYCQKEHYNDAFKNVLVINSALSKYLQGNKTEAKSILDKKDWSATSDDFKLAYEVLTDDFEKAYEIMTKIGRNGDVDESNYKQWPLFSQIKKEDKFKETYKAIFGSEYSVLETPMRPLQELINKEITRNKDLKQRTVRKVESAKEKKEKEDNLEGNGTTLS